MTQMTDLADGATGNHPYRLGLRPADGETEVAELIGELITALRRELAPADVTARCDGSISRIPPAAATSPEFRHDALLAASAVGRHLAAAPPRGRRVPWRRCRSGYRVEFSAAPATGTLRCDIRSRARVDGVASEHLAAVLDHAGGQLMCSAKGDGL